MWDLSTLLTIVFFITLSFKYESIHNAPPQAETLFFITYTCTTVDTLQRDFYPWSCENTFNTSDLIVSLKTKTHDTTVGVNSGDQHGEIFFTLELSSLWATHFCYTHTTYSPKTLRW